jgi:hypothetical protein
VSNPLSGELPAFGTPPAVTTIMRLCQLVRPPFAARGLFYRIHALSDGGSVVLGDYGGRGRPFRVVTTAWHLVSSVYLVSGSQSVRAASGERGRVS